MFHILYDGTVFDHRDHTVLGGDADAILARITESYGDDLDAGARRARRRRRPGRARPHPAGRPSSRSPCWRGATAAAASVASATTQVAALLASSD